MNRGSLCGPRAENRRINYEDLRCWNGHNGEWHCADAVAEWVGSIAEREVRRVVK